LLRFKPGAVTKPPLELMVHRAAQRVQNHKAGLLTD
jgi:hypothetical protein